MLFCICLNDRQLHILLYLAAVCPLLIDPSNGVMACSLGDDGAPSYEDTCNFTCNTGYELAGSDTRTCQSDGSWSGNDVVCRRGKYYVYFYINMLIGVVIP